MKDDRISDAPLGGVGTKLLHEDDRVRIWEMRLAPGEESPAHRHELEHILVVIDGDRIAAVPHVQSPPGTEYFVAEVQPGNFYRQPRGGVEVARNVGDRTFHEILIELKD
jgi:hypothetical protein